jgi:hypothetical protein
MTKTTKTTRTPTIDAAISEGVLTLTFADGREIRLSPTLLSEEVRGQALLHGLKQKLVDAAAISRNPETGRSATVEDKYNAVREVYTRLLSGEWSKRREGSGGANGGLLFAALVRLYAGKKSPDEIRAFLEKMTDAEQAALRASSRVAPIIADIRAERDAAKVGKINGDALLDKLEGDTDDQGDGNQGNQGDDDDQGDEDTDE